MSGTEATLIEACRTWQTDTQFSSLLRGAARVLTGVPHYFHADFIVEHERQAAANVDVLSQARTLIAAVEDSEAVDGAGWRIRCGLPPHSSPAARGLASKATDEMIEASLDTGVLTMPLWGFSLSEEVARGFGERFLLRLHGAFHAVAAWRESGVLPEQQEMIGGGRYRIVELRRCAFTTEVDLMEEQPVARSWLRPSLPPPSTHLAHGA